MNRYRHLLQIEKYANMAGNVYVWKWFTENHFIIGYIELFCFYEINCILYITFFSSKC